MKGVIGDVDKDTEERTRVKDLRSCVSKSQVKQDKTRQKKDKRGRNRICRGGEIKSRTAYVIMRV